MRTAVLAALSQSPPAVADTTVTWLWIAALASPLLSLLKAALLTALGWAVAVFLGHDLRLRVLLSVNVYAQALVAFSALCTALVLRLRLEAVRSAADLIVPQGFDLLVNTAGSPVLMSLAQQTTVFHLLSILLLLWLLPRATSLTPAASAAIVFVLYAAGLAVAFVRGVAFA